MKKLVKLSLLLAGALSCQNMSAALVNFSGSPNAPIPDNNASGLAFGFTVTTPFSSIDSVVVTLSISGGYNGDLYAYLSHGSGFAVLLNRVGVTGTDPLGYPDSGFNVTLSPGGTDIHQYRTTLGGARRWSSERKLGRGRAARSHRCDPSQHAGCVHRRQSEWRVDPVFRGPFGRRHLDT